MADERWRILNRDGTFNIDREGLPRLRREDLYHSLLFISWLHLLSLLGAGFILANLVFGSAYFLLGHDAISGLDAGPNWRTFAECFFFSVQTMATIGYGRISPSGMIANLIATLECMTGIFGIAVTTGLVFARFARPTARIRFSRLALLTQVDGILSLVFRMGNERPNQIVDAALTLTLIRRENTLEGESYRNFYNLELEQNRSPFFALTWTAVHPITEESPLSGLSREQMVSQEIEILANVIGIDETFSQTIHARFSYTPDDLVWGGRFKDVLSRSPDGRIRADLSQLSEIE